MQHLIGLDYLNIAEKRIKECKNAMATFACSSVVQTNNLGMRFMMTDDHYLLEIEHAQWKQHQHAHGLVGVVDRCDQ